MKKNRKKWLAILTAGAMLLTSVNMPFVKTESRAAGYGISNPRVEKDVLISGDDSEKLEGTISNPVVKGEIATWDCITFGSYWQEDTNGDGKVDQTDEKQPIKWRVLSVDGDDAFLLADQNLDCQSYNTQYTDVTWETCTVRKWLNSTFLEEAFSEKEQSAIKDTKVVNNENTYYGTDGGQDTVDKIYLLSIDEVKDSAYGFATAYKKDSRAREAVNTGYAGRNNIKAHESDGWYLRSPGDKQGNVAVISVKGAVNNSGTEVNKNGMAKIRPVLHINLQSSEWKATEKTRVVEYISKVVWNSVWFGNYWQEDTNGDGVANQNDAKQPIKWRVLSVKDDDVFLLADKNMDCQPYNELCVDVTWETCSLRKWLNSTFLQSAFTEEEQFAINDTNVLNEDNSFYDTEGGNDTVDKIYLLSVSEVCNMSYGFSGGADWILGESSIFEKSENTAYTRAAGARMETGFWWLRTPGIDSDAAAYIDLWGKGIVYGLVVDNGKESNDRMTIRPVLHIKKSSSLWKSASDVTISENTSNISVIPTPTASPTLTAPPTPTMPSMPIRKSTNILQNKAVGANISDVENANKTVDKKALSKVILQRAKNKKGKKIFIQWNVDKVAKGYEIQYAPNKKFKKVKSQTVRSTSVTIKKLKKEKTYFIRVRSYRVIDGKKMYGKWSSVKKVKIKK